MRDKRILIISPLPKENIKGGIASWTERLMNSGLPEGYSFELVDSSVSAARGIFNNFNYSIFQELFRTFKILSNFIFLIRNYSPSIVHLNCSISPFGVFRDSLCLIITKLFKLPIVIHYRGNLSQNWKKYKFGNLSKLSLHYLIKHSSSNLAMNKSSLRYIQNIRSNKNDKIIGSFIEDAFFLNERVVDKDKEIEIIYVGAITKTKGSEEVLKLAKLFNNIQFTLIGKISEDMNKLVLDVPENLCFLGQKNKDEIQKRLLEADIFIFLSHSEGFPNAVLEAMASGLSVIGTNVGAMSEMIDEGKGGFLVEVGDLKSAENKIKELSKDFFLRQSMGQHNRNKALQEYTYDTIIGKLTNTYDNLLASVKK